MPERWVKGTRRGMSDRLTSHLLVGALIRRTQAQGGTAMVLHKGESIGGSIIVQLLERGRNLGFFERITALNGTAQLAPCGPQTRDQDTENSQYIERRVARDPDIWVLELDVAQGEQLAAEVLCAG
jgi:hypothetical protein